MSAVSTVEGIKASLAKMVHHIDSMPPESVEKCKDMFEQLDGCEVTLDVLTETLIGTIVSKFKNHEEIGPTAKALVKKWKKVAKSGGTPQTSPAPTNKPKKQLKKKMPEAPSMERRASVSAAVEAAEEEWGSLQPHRQSTVKKLHSFLIGHKSSMVKEGVNGDAVEHLAVERATEIEEAMNKKVGRDKSEYLTKARSLCFNIKSNQALASQVLLGQLEAKELVTMSPEQMANEDARKEREAKARKLQDSNRLDWDQANEDKINKMCGITGDLLKASLFTCGRCKSVKTTSTQKQTRSADEPMTVFVLCLNCGKRWKC